jgi:hypothetical protein
MRKSFIRLSRRFTWAREKTLWKHGQTPPGPAVFSTAREQWPSRWREASFPQSALPLCHTDVDKSIKMEGTENAKAAVDVAFRVSICQGRLERPSPRRLRCELDDSFQPNRTLAELPYHWYGLISFKVNRIFLCLNA